MSRLCLVFFSRGQKDFLRQLSHLRIQPGSSFARIVTWRPPLQTRKFSAFRTFLNRGQPQPLGSVTTFVHEIRYRSSGPNSNFARFSDRILGPKSPEIFGICCYLTAAITKDLPRSDTPKTIESAAPTMPFPGIGGPPPTFCVQCQNFVSIPKFSTTHPLAGSCV
jgi:hypothetical protein